VLTFSQECDYPSEKYGGCQDAPKTTAVKTVVSEQFDKLTVKLGITLFPYNRFTRTNFMRDCKES
jgi:hypothetical protein